MKFKRVKDEELGEGLEVDKTGTQLFMPNKDLDEVLYSSYAEKFSTGKVNQNTWLSHYIDKQLDKLSKNAESLSPVAFREINRIVRDTQEFYNKKKATDTDFARYLLRRKLFPWQIEVFDCKSKDITLLAGRRSGKSYLVVELALDHCLEEPPVINGVKKYRSAAIIGLAFNKTKTLYWDNIKSAIEEAHIAIKSIDNSNCLITFPNGNKLGLFGNSNTEEREKMRGFDISFCAVDECQSQKGLGYLLDTVIGPMLRGTAGTLVLAGTAPLHAGTEWERAITSSTFTHFHATMEDNPSIPNYQHALEEELEKHHWTKDNINFRREFLGELAYDTNILIYPYRTYYDDIPDTFKPEMCFIGVDYGWRDYTSFAPIIVGQENNNETAYLVDEFKENRIPASEIVKKMDILVKKISLNFHIPVENIYIVQDPSHTAIGVDILNQNSNLNLVNAIKMEQNAQIARVEEALETGMLKIKKGDHFDSECDRFVWQFNDEYKSVIYKIDDTSFHADIADSVQYAWNTYLSYTHCNFDKCED